MSNSDKERIAVLETNSKNIMEELKDIKIDIKSIGEKLDKALDKQETKIEILFKHKNILYGAYAMLVITAGIIIKLSYNYLINTLDQKVSDSVASALKEQVIVENE